MLFDRLADGIIKHPKAIIAFWLIVLLVAVPFAVKAPDVMSYDTADMADKDSESIRGFEVIEEYFPGTQTDVSNTPIIVIHYNDKAGKIQATQLLGVLSSEETIGSYVFEDGPHAGEPKISGFMPMMPQEKEDGSGILMVGVIYAEYEDIPEGIAVSDTLSLREFLHSVEMSADLSLNPINNRIIGIDSEYDDEIDKTLTTIKVAQPFTGDVGLNVLDSEGKVIWSQAPYDFSGKTEFDWAVEGKLADVNDYTFVLIDNEVEITQAGSGESADIDVYLTGNLAIMQDMADGAAEDISQIDPFTILLILVLVGLFFRSLVTSATPPMTIGFAFVVVLGLIFGLSHLFNIFFITEMMLLVSMMGAGCDYCIFVIARYREELRSGKTHAEALHQAVVWAGESIATSGASVIIGFGVMSVCSFSLISTMGICLALGIIVALLAALTLIPAILTLVGDRIFWPSTMKAFEKDGKATRGWYAFFGRAGEKYFDKSSRFSIKHAKAIVLVAVLITVPAAYLTATNETSYDMMSSMQTGESGEGMDYIGEYADQGMLMPNYAIIEFKEPFATISPYDKDPTVKTLHWNENWDTLNKILLPKLYSDIQSDDNVAYVIAPFMWNAELQKALVGLEITLTELKEHPEMYAGAVIKYVMDDTEAVTSMALATFFEQAIAKISYGLEHPSNPKIEPLPHDQAVVMAEVAVAFHMSGEIDWAVNTGLGILGGEYTATGEGDVSFIRISVATSAPAMAPVSMDTIGHIRSCVNDFIDTANTTSEVVEAKWITGSAVVMFEVSEVIGDEFVHIEILVVILIILLLFVVMRSYTIPFRSVLTILMSITWTLALTHLVFVDILGSEVMWLIPLILLVICLGLGMDYDILLTTRIKENVMARGMSNDDGIHHAVTHTGSVITICGLIMGGAFGTLMLSSMTLMQEFGFALCFAILVDALIVRTYIVPAVMHLLGGWNWKGPGFMQKKPENGQ